MKIKLLPAIASATSAVRWRLVALVAVILVPALVFGGWLIAQAAESERLSVERDAASKAGQILGDIEHVIASAKAMLTALASSHFIQTQDFESFHRQATDVARQLDMQIVLTDNRSGVQITNAALPWGAPTPTPLNIPVQASNARKETIRTGQPAISDVYYAPVLKRFVVSVGIPIERDGERPYYLAVGIPVDKFAAELQGGMLPPEWVVSLIDRNNSVVARSENHDEMVGKKLSVDFVGRAQGSEGVSIGDGANPRGLIYHWTWRRSAITGWFVAVGIPFSVLAAPRNSALTTYAAAGSSLLGISLVLAFFWGGRLAQSVGEMGIDREPTREEFRILFESAPNGVLVIDNGGQIAMTNSMIEAKFGYSRAELIGKTFEILVPERFRGSHVSLRELFTAMPESMPMGAGRDLFGLRKDGSEFRIEIDLNPIKTRNGNFVMATVVDITARLLAEQRLNTAVAERDSLQRRFMRAQEDERLRLAHDLHDQTGQSLTAAMLELKNLELLLTENNRLRAREVRKSMEQMGETIHRIAWELRPASIDELGLTSALSNYVSEWSLRFGIEADFHCRNEQLDSIHGDKRTVIYRVLQEALTNVAKHATDVSSVSIIIDRIGPILQLTIEDNGKGFETSEIDGAGRNSGGLGLAGMRERLALIGGEFEVESSVGSGTTVFARIPLDDERAIA